MLYKLFSCKIASLFWVVGSELDGSNLFPARQSSNVLKVYSNLQLSLLHQAPRSYLLNSLLPLMDPQKAGVFMTEAGLMFTQHSPSLKHYMHLFPTVTSWLCLLCVLDAVFLVSTQDILPSLMSTWITVPDSFCFHRNKLFSEKKCRSWAGLYLLGINLILKSIYLQNIA